MKRILVTGAAGFIGANLVQRLLRSHPEAFVVGLDSVNDYYDPAIKYYRLEQIAALARGCGQERWLFVKGNIADKGVVESLFAEHQFDIVELMLNISP